MKLYTEADLMDFIDRNGCIVESDLDEKQLTTIELPSGEEIHIQATDYSSDYYEFRAGAKWMRDKIQGGNK